MIVRNISISRGELNTGNDIIYVLPLITIDDVNWAPRAITFSNLSGEPISVKAFTAEEYLQYQEDSGISDDFAFDDQRNFTIDFTLRTEMTLLVKGLGGGNHTSNVFLPVIYTKNGTVDYFRENLAQSLTINQNGFTDGFSGGFY